MWRRRGEKKEGLWMDETVGYWWWWIYKQCIEGYSKMICFKDNRGRFDLKLKRFCLRSRNQTCSDGDETFIHTISTNSKTAHVFVVLTRLHRVRVVFVFVTSSQLRFSWMLFSPCCCSWNGQSGKAGCPAGLITYREEAVSYHLLFHFASVF